MQVADYTESCVMGNEIIQAVSPLVLHFLGRSSSQGLANLLWALAKMVNPPHGTMMVIVNRWVTCTTNKAELQLSH